MAVLITYDVSGEQSTIKQALLDLGYQDFYFHQSRTYYLPNTTLWHPSFDLQKGMQDLESVTQTRGIVLLRAVAAPFHEFWGIPGAPHK